MGSIKKAGGAASSFNDDWEYRPTEEPEWLPITLPHDAMLREGRREDSPSGTHMANFLGGKYIYRKIWHVPNDISGKVIDLIFDGVYKHSRVVVNGKDVGGCLSGWTRFQVRIDVHLIAGSANTIEVHVDNDCQPSARWYTGSGIHREVALLVRSHDMLLPDGIRLNTVFVDGNAHVAVDILLNNPENVEIPVKVELSRPGHETAVWKSQTSGSEIHGKLDVVRPALWSSETPNLYNCTVTVKNDVYSFNYGLRTLEWVPQKGLLVNGKTVLLRGGCIHADNGVLGAVSLKTAEVRRMKLMKESGFNAIRMSHHPASAALLEACDEVGIYVMDEYSDYWYMAKSDHDEAGNFLERWKTDIDAMVARARNHASVIMYSLGNEVTEPSTAFGHATAKDLLDYQRSIDPTRPNTVAVNLMIATVSFSKVPPGDPSTPPSIGGGGSIMPNLGSSLFNQLFNQLTGVMNYVSMLPYTNTVTETLYSYMDITGYNYGSYRWSRDERLHPSRLLLGTESTPPDVVHNWDQVKRIPNLVGDFMWTAWDYIGEVGIGGYEYNVPWYWMGLMYKPYPYLTAACGVLDITGVPGAPAFVAQAAWGLLEKPAITVRPLNISHMRYRRTAWRSTDAVPGWGWKGCEGKKAYVEVISQEQEVELFLNDRFLGRAKSGLHTNYTAKFTTQYEPGELVAIAYTDGVERSRSTVSSAGPASLKMINEKSQDLIADGQDLAFIRLELSDDKDVLEMNDDDEVVVEVTGPATLAGLGTGKPDTTERFDDSFHTMFRGQALAVVRSSTTSGMVVVKATSKRHGSASITIAQNK
ncbi:beta-galactosidase [Corynespora cassiicola Philippines]|uniref:Beta-galactosidase n=1 Tax=Corynespora cassiicola Philippines TaxID=1448308 RepID=A0A2T2P5S2_CORCC|nr:beta-galactosidase [Corynespora cassiicola Philippines]